MRFIELKMFQSQNQSDLQCITIAVVSNITFETYLKTYMTEAFSASTSCFQLIFIQYNELYEKQDALSCADIIVVCINFDVLYPYVHNNVISNKVLADDIIKNSINQCREIYSLIKAFSNVKVIWFGFEDYFINNDIVCGNALVLCGMIDRINQALYNMLTDDIYVDFKRLIAKLGIPNAYSTKEKYRWNAPYSKGLVALIADEVYKQYLIHTGQTKKCLVLDCDNVLWGGILSEDGIERIKLGKSGMGRSYYDFQSFVLSLYQHGVILAVCSKNDEEDVLRVFREHREMPLKEKHISCFMVNWENKPSNIEKIAEYLNIGLGSIVFVDDSPIEIESVKELLPEVTTIQFNNYMNYEPFSCFNLKSEYDFDDIEKRTKTYQTNGLRNDLKRTSADYGDYVRSLNVVVDIHKALPVEFSRISELTQRTNKCTNGRRYTIEDIKERIFHPSISLYSVSVSDRFSDLGLVGAMEVENNDLTLFSLSCRALGRDVERTMIEYLLANHRVNSFNYLSTNKNGELQKMLTDIINQNNL